MEVLINNKKNINLNKKLNTLLDNSKSEKENFEEILAVYEDYLNLQKEFKLWDELSDSSLETLNI